MLYYGQTFVTLPLALPGKGETTNAQSLRAARNLQVVSADLKDLWGGAGRQVTGIDLKAFL